MATSKANAADTKTTDTPVDKKATVAESTTEKKATTAKKATESKSEAKKETAKKAAAKKPAAKKTTTTKKAATKKAQEIEAKTLIQYSGKEIAASDILETVKKVWVEKFQGKLEEIKTIEIYIKPEENKAYFVVNGLSNGDYFVEL